MEKSLSNEPQHANVPEDLQLAAIAAGQSQSVLSEHMALPRSTLEFGNIGIGTRPRVGGWESA